MCSSDLGALGPAPTLSYADVFNAGTLTVVFNDYTTGSYNMKGTVTYAGLAPGLAGLYQINVQVPAGFTTGDNVYLEIQTTDADVNEVRIPVR